MSGTRKPVSVADVTGGSAPANHKTAEPGASIPSNPAAPSAASAAGTAVQLVPSAEISAVKIELAALKKELAGVKKKLEDGVDSKGNPLSAEDKVDLRKDKEALNNQIAGLQEKENLLLKQLISPPTNSGSGGAGGGAGGGATGTEAAIAIAKLTALVEDSRKETDKKLADVMNLLRSSQTSAASAVAAGALPNTIRVGTDYRASLEQKRITMFNSGFGGAPPVSSAKAKAWGVVLQTGLPTVAESEDDKFHPHFQALAHKIMSDCHATQNATLWHTFNKKTLAHAGVQSSAAALKPDFSVTSKGLAVTELTTVTVVEVKQKDFDDDARAQTLSYGYSLLRHNPTRATVFVALTNLRSIQLWRLQRGVKDAIAIDEYAEQILDSADGFGTLKFLLTEQPSALGFTCTVVTTMEYDFVLTGLLGAGNSATVYSASERSGKLTSSAPTASAGGAATTATATATTATATTTNTTTTAVTSRSSTAVAVRERAARKRAKAVAAALSSPQRPRSDHKTAPSATPDTLWVGALKVWRQTESAADQFRTEVAVYERLNGVGCSAVLRMAAHSAPGEQPQWIALDGIGVAIKELLAGDVPELVTAIRALHSHGVAHNDLRPQNILQTESGLKLCDFGCACACACACAADAKTTTPASAAIPATTMGGGASFTCCDALLRARQTRQPQTVTPHDDFTALARAAFVQHKRDKPDSVDPKGLLDWWAAQLKQSDYLQAAEKALTANDFELFARVIAGPLPKRTA